MRQVSVFEAYSYAVVQFHYLFGYKTYSSLISVLKCPTSLRELFVLSARLILFFLFISQSIAYLVGAILFSMAYSDSRHSCGAIITWLALFSFFGLAYVFIHHLYYVYLNNRIILISLLLPVVTISWNIYGSTLVLHPTFLKDFKDCSMHSNGFAALEFMYSFLIYFWTSMALYFYSFFILFIFESGNFFFSYRPVATK